MKRLVLVMLIFVEQYAFFHLGGRHKGARTFSLEEDLEVNLQEDQTQESKGVKKVKIRKLFLYTGSNHNLQEQHQEPSS